jgi:L-fuculose-phosphate aldolase
MVALGDSLPVALTLASEIEVLAAHYWRAVQLGAPHVLTADELDDVRRQYASYGQPRR